MLKAKVDRSARKINFANQQPQKLPVLVAKNLGSLTLGAAFLYICCNPRGDARVCIYWTVNQSITPIMIRRSALLLLTGPNLSPQPVQVVVAW